VESIDGSQLNGAVVVLQQLDKSRNGDHKSAIILPLMCILAMP
jgi:hypothetical protein